MENDHRELMLVFNVFERYFIWRGDFRIMMGLVRDESKIYIIL